MRINLSTGVQKLIATVPHVSPRAIALTRAWIFVTDGTVSTESRSHPRERGWAALHCSVAPSAEPRAIERGPALF
jgi:hypothetical protein